jgi:hypothetical protein
LLSNGRETNNETKIVYMQQLRDYATVLEPLLGSGPQTTMNMLLEAVFSVWFDPRLYHSTGRVQLVSAVEWSELVGE